MSLIDIFNQLRVIHLVLFSLKVYKHYLKLIDENYLAFFYFVQIFILNLFHAILPNVKKHSCSRPLHC